MKRPRRWQVSTRWIVESTSGNSFPAWTVTGEAGGHQSPLSLEMPPVFRANLHALDGFAVLCLNYRAGNRSFLLRQNGSLRVCRIDLWREKETHAEQQGDHGNPLNQTDHNAVEAGK